MEYVFSICVKFELYSNNGILNIYNRIEKEERLRKREVEDDILLKEQRARSLELDKSVTIQKVSSTMSTIVCTVVFSVSLSLYGPILFRRFCTIFPTFVYTW